MAEKVIGKAYESTVNNSKALETALSGHLEIIRQNRAELMGANEPEEAQEPMPEEQFAPEMDESAPYEEPYPQDEE